MKWNVCCPEDAVIVSLVLIVGNVAQVTPVPTDFKYWPLDPVVPSWTAILLLNLAVLSNCVVDAKVVTPATLTLSKLVCPSTSISEFKSIGALTVTCSKKVDTPATVTLSKSVWPSTSIWKKSPSPTNVVAVTTPAIETLSKFVWPSTSMSALMSTLLLNVDMPETSKVELISTGAANVPIPKTFKWYTSVIPLKSALPLTSSWVAVKIPIL